MKRLFFFLLFFLIMPQTIMAVEFGKPGYIEASASLGFFSHRMTFYQDPESSSLSEKNYFFSPSLGYFILPQFSIGISLYYSNTMLISSDDQKMTSTSVGYFLHSQYHWKLYKNFLFFLGGIYGTTIRNEPANTIATLVSSNFLGDTLGIETGIKYYYRDFIIALYPTFLFSQMYHERDLQKDFYSRYSVFNLAIGMLL